MSTTLRGVPDELIRNEELAQDLKALPGNYNFEVLKTLARIGQLKARRVALQMPEGLLIYACTIADILVKYGGVGNGRPHGAVECVIMGDVTYGACCIDDLSARALGCDLVVHYGHSCLLPVQHCEVPILYVFVSIAFDYKHLVASMQLQFKSDSRLALVATIQFVSVLHQIRAELTSLFPSIQVPQARPLSPGELLGCTAPNIQDCDALVYVADGRFHLEASMIANPGIPAFRYDPYSKSFTHEKYSLEEMKSSRLAAIEQSKQASKFGVILGTLGRQGSVAILRRVASLMESKQKPYVVVLISELSPPRLSLFEESVDAWVQIACPRLSIDWGSHFTKPLLTTYECMVALGHVAWRDRYPMDYYARSGGEWSNYYKAPDKETSPEISLTW